MKRRNVFPALFCFLALTLLECGKEEIVSDEAILISLSQVAVTEGEGHGSIALRLSAPLPENAPLIFKVTTNDKSVIFFDPAPIDGLLTLPVTDNTAYFTISSPADTKFEPNQTVSFSLVNSGNIMIGENGTFNIGIRDCSLSSGLVAEYLFDGNAKDTSLKGNDGIVGTGATSTTDKAGKAGSAFSFDGSPEGSITIPHNKDIDFGRLQNFTVSVWVAAGDTQNDLGGNLNDILRKWDGGTQAYSYGISYYNSSAPAPKLFAGARSTGGACGQGEEVRSGSGAISAGFHHIIFMKQESNLSLYIDNVLAASSIDGTSCETNNTSPLVIGRRGGATPRAFTGKIDDIRIYNRSLTSGERGSLFAL